MEIISPVKILQLNLTSLETSGKRQNFKNFPNRLSDPNRNGRLILATNIGSSQSNEVSVIGTKSIYIFLVARFSLRLYLAYRYFWLVFFATSVW